VVAASFSGLLVDTIGWIDFFYLSTLLAIPGMLLLIWVAPFNARYNATAQSKGEGE
jgi:PAT family beta-lactamase induction signal transducer AmpG